MELEKGVIQKDVIRSRHQTLMVHTVLNTDGIFFFTTEGAYVEWKGDYMMSDQPLKLTTTPELVREIK